MEVVRTACRLVLEVVPSGMVLGLPHDRVVVQRELLLLSDVIWMMSGVVVGFELGPERSPEMVVQQFPLQMVLLLMSAMPFQWLYEMGFQQKLLQVVLLLVITESTDSIRVLCVFRLTCGLMGVRVKTIRSLRAWASGRGFCCYMVEGDGI